MKYTQVKIKQKKDWTKNLKNILDKPRQSNNVKISEHPTGTLATTSQKTGGGENRHVWFGYSPHTIFYHTLGQVSVSIKADLIN